MTHLLRRITDDEGAIALADRLNGQERTRPVVVITIPALRREPYIDAETVLDEVVDLADVYLIATGTHTWTFSRKMPELTQVYGGAGRVYPVGHEWVSDPYVSPLRFAYNEGEGQRSTQTLISDALRMAAAAGLVHRRPSRHRVQVAGEVVAIPMPERALVKFDGRLAPVAQELTVPDVPLDRVVAIGMRVGGWFDSVTRRLDISESLLSPEIALEGYTVGDVVLTEVATVEADRAELRLHPLLGVPVSRDNVTANDLDDLRTLMTPGEVLAARVTSTGPDWALTLLDVDDDEVPRVAASLLPGGPPWLRLAPAEDIDHDWADEAPVGLARGLMEVGSEPVTLEVSRAAEAPSEAVTPSRPTPAMLDRRGAPAPRSQQSAPAASVTDRTIASLQAELASLGRKLAAAESDLRGSDVERADLIDMRQAQSRRIDGLEDQLKRLRTRLRKTKQPPSPSGTPTPEFADAEQAFRYAVLSAWATRTPVGEQASRPLVEYDLGPEFLDSVRSIQGVTLDKIADVVVEIVAGRAHEIAGRDLHQLRESAAPNAPYVRRPTDDATCWRAALQVSTPQARRIHYWVLPGGRVELSRVALHDDYRP